jgi:hypothetical protein
MNELRYAKCPSDKTLRESRRDLWARVYATLALAPARKGESELLMSENITIIAWVYLFTGFNGAPIPVGTSVYT